jgi:hypothetical protein
MKISILEKRAGKFMPEKFYEIEPRNKWPGLFGLFFSNEIKETVFNHRH